MESGKGKKVINFTVERPQNHQLNQVVKVTTTRGVVWTVCTQRETMRGPLAWVIFFPQNPKPESNHEKNIKAKLRENSTKLFKAVKIMKTTERLTNCQRPKETHL